MTDILAIAKEYGPWVCIIAFFVYRDYKREQAMGELLTGLNVFIRDTLMKTIRESTDAINRQTESNRGLIDVMKDRRCLMEELSHGDQSPKR